MENFDDQSFDQYICRDCALYIVNGDLPDDSDETRDKEITDGVEAAYPYNWAVDTSEDSCHFSSKPCDCCKTRLGGDRLYARLYL